MSLPSLIVSITYFCQFVKHALLPNCGKVFLNRGLIKMCSEFFEKWKWLTGLRSKKKASWGSLTSKLCGCLVETEKKFVNKLFKATTT